MYQRSRIPLLFKINENLHWLRTPSFRVTVDFSLSLKGSASSICCRLYLTASCRCPHHHQNEILDRTVQESKNFIIDHLGMVKFDLLNSDGNTEIYA